jgi:hypothetical protein
MQNAIAGPIPLAADIVQAFEQRSELIEILQTAHVLLLDRERGLGFHAGHAHYHAKKEGPAQPVQGYLLEYYLGANLVPNTIGTARVEI